MGTQKLLFPVREDHLYDGELICQNLALASGYFEFWILDFEFFWQSIAAKELHRAFGQC